MYTQCNIYICLPLTRILSYDTGLITGRGTIEFHVTKIRQPFLLVSRGLCTKSNNALRGSEVWQRKTNFVWQARNKINYVSLIIQYSNQLFENKEQLDIEYMAILF